MKKRFIKIVALFFLGLGIVTVQAESDLSKEQNRIANQLQVQREKTLKKLEELEACGQSKEQIITILDKAVARAAENGDPFIDVRSDNKIWWYVGGAVGVVAVVVGGYYIYKYCSKPNNPNPNNPTGPRIVRLAQDFVPVLRNIDLGDLRTWRQEETRFFAANGIGQDTQEAMQLRLGMAEVIIEGLRRMDPSAGQAAGLAVMQGTIDTLPVRVAEIAQRNESVPQLRQRVTQQGPVLMGVVMQQVVASAMQGAI